MGGGAAVLEDLGNIGDFLGGIGVVATLVYLALQIRQNTEQLRQNSRSVRAASVSSHTATRSQLSLTLGQSYELAKLYMDGLSGEAELDVVQQAQFENLLGTYLIQIAEIVHLDHEGVLSAELRDEYKANIDWLVEQPGFKIYWQKWGAMSPLRHSIEPLLQAAAQQGAGADSA